MAMTREQVQEAGYKDLQKEFSRVTGRSPAGVKKDVMISALLEAIDNPAAPVEAPDLPPVEQVIAEVTQEATENGKSRAALRRERDQAGAQAAMEAAQNAPALSEEARKAGFKVYNVETFKGVGGRYARSGRCSIPNCTTGGNGQKGAAVYMKYPKAYCWEHSLAAFRRLGVKQPFEDDAQNERYGFAARPSDDVNEEGGNEEE